MDPLIEQPDTKLKSWRPDTADEVRMCLAEIIKRADRDSLGLGRSRAVEQEVLDSLDEPQLTAAINRALAETGSDCDPFVGAACLAALKRTEW